MSGTTIAADTLAAALTRSQKTGLTRELRMVDRAFSLIAGADPVMPRSMGLSIGSEHVLGAARIVKQAAEGTTGPVSAAFTALAQDGAVFARQLEELSGGATRASGDTEAAARWTSMISALRHDILHPPARKPVGLPIDLAGGTDARAQLIRARAGIPLR